MPKSEEFYENLYLEYLETSYPKLSKEKLSNKIGSNYKKALAKKGLTSPTTFVELESDVYAKALFEHINEKQDFVTYNDCVLTLIYKVWMHKCVEFEEKVDLDGRFASNNALVRAKLIQGQKRTSGAKIGSRIKKYLNKTEEFFNELKEPFNESNNNVILEKLNEITELLQENKNLLKEQSDLTQLLHQQVVQLKLLGGEQEG